MNSTVDKPKSSFITVLAWILIVLSGFMLLASILNNILVNTVFPGELLASASQQSGVFDPFDFMFSHLRLIIAIVGILSLIFFLSSLALLKRKNWARISISALLVLAILYVITATGFQWTYLFDLSSAHGSLGFFQLAVIATFGLFSISFTVLFGWLIFKLNSKKIRAEFIDHSQ